MLKLKKSDLAFLSSLDIKITATAIKGNDTDGKIFWTLHIKAENNKSQEGFLYGARGEIRRFYQLNALVEACKNYIINCKEVIIKI